MYNKKSDYALNKINPTAIVCISVTGDNIELTREQFASEEEFMFWKQWSDTEYQETEHRCRGYYDNTVSLNEDIDAVGESLENELIFAMDKDIYERECEKQMEQVRSILTKIQFRRLWRYHALGMSEQQIADMEGVGQQRISNSITDAHKKIEKIFGLASKKGGKNG